MDIKTYKELEEEGRVNKVILAGSEGDTYAIFYDEYSPSGVKTTKVEGINKAAIDEEEAAALKLVEDIRAFKAAVVEE